MLDAKLVAMTGLMGVLVYVGIGYVERADTVSTADPFTDKIRFMCDNFDGGGCAGEICNQLKAGSITTQTPLVVSCDGFSTTGTLDAMGSSDDWEARAELVNSEEPAHATEEWCAAAGSDAPSSGITITDSTDAAMGECGAYVAIIAASVNAEYNRFVARQHMEEFSEAIDLFCADTDDADLQFGCDELRAGFKGSDSAFKVACGDGSYATFVLGSMISSLDEIRANGGGAAEVQAYMTGQCGRRLDEVSHIADFHQPAITTAREAAGIHHEAGNDELNEAATPEGRQSERSLSTLVDSAAKKERRLSLKGLLKNAAPEDERAPELNERVLGWHGHWPHRHNPHSHSTPGDCTGCANKCGNVCFGRCGPGCTKWAACGCGGAKSHQACWHHDTKCSCGAMWYPSCMALMGTSLVSAPSWLSGANYGNSGCSGSTWIFHQSVQGWGKIFMGWNTPSTACSKAGSW